MVNIVHCDILTPVLYCVELSDYDGTHTLMVSHYGNNDGDMVALESHCSRLVENASNLVVLLFSLFQPYGVFGIEIIFELSCVSLVFSKISIGVQELQTKLFCDAIYPTNKRCS